MGREQIDITGFDKPPRSETLPGVPIVCGTQALIAGGGYAVVKDITITEAMIQHRISLTHNCNGIHKDLGGIPIHHCVCGASFYLVTDAVRILVQQWEDLLIQLECINE